jgi:hypothetical protein
VVSSPAGAAAAVCCGAGREGSGEVLVYCVVAWHGWLYHWGMMLGHWGPRGLRGAAGEGPMVQYPRKRIRRNVVTRQAGMPYPPVDLPRCGVPALRAPPQHWPHTAHNGCYPAPQRHRPNPTAKHTTPQHNTHIARTGPLPRAPPPGTRAGPTGPRGSLKGTATRRRPPAGAHHAGARRVGLMLGPAPRLIGASVRAS